MKPGGSLSISWSIGRYATGADPLPLPHPLPIPLPPPLHLPLPLPLVFLVVLPAKYWINNKRSQIYRSMFNKTIEYHFFFCVS